MGHREETLPRVEQSEETRGHLEDAGLDMMASDEKNGAYRMRLTKPDFEKHQQVISDLLKQAYDSRE